LKDREVDAELSAKYQIYNTMTNLGFIHQSEGKLKLERCGSYEFCLCCWFIFHYQRQEELMLEIVIYEEK
jgi:hypothetical protein